MRGLIAIILSAVAGCHACDGDRANSARPSEQRRAAEPSFSAAKGYDPDWSAARSASPARSTDPLRSRWSLADAIDTLPPGDELIAVIDTSMGQLRCKLMADKAPRTVALFIGMANGTHPLKTIRGSARQPAYDGSRFDRVAAGVLIAGGRPKPAAGKAPGFALPNESRPGMRHDKAGQLCLGAGLELVITAGPAAILDKPADGAASRPPFTVIGSCQPLALIMQIAALEAIRGRPKVPVAIDKVRVGR